MKRISLKVEKREILGKKVKKLRREGIIPANVYGKGIKSQAVQVEEKAFTNVYKEAGETGVLDLQLNSHTIPVLIHNVNKDYKGNTLHADFFKVDLTQKVKTTVPIETIGEPKAVTNKIGILMNILNEVEIEALPENLPDKIEVMVENLSNIDDQVTVSDLKAPEGVEILSAKEQVVAKIGELVTKEAQEQAAAEAAAAEAAKEEAAAETGVAEGEQTAPEGEQPVLEGETPKEAETPAKEAEKPEEPTQ